MYPTLYHMLDDWFGLQLQVLKLVNTFGLVVALAFFGAAATLARELERKGKLGLLPVLYRPVPPPETLNPLEIAISAVFVFLIAYKFSAVALGEVQLHGGNDAQRFLLSTQGSWIGGTLLTLAWVGYRVWSIKNAEKAAEAKETADATEKTTEANPTDTPTASAEDASKTAPAKTGQPPPGYVAVTPREHTAAITSNAAIGGLIGAKVFHWLETPQDILEMVKHPSINAIFSGLTIYGGLIVGALAVYRYCKKQGLGFAHVCDATAPGLMLAYGIGRLGCQLAGDGDWGIANPAPQPHWLSFLPEWTWAFDYPNNVLHRGVAMASGGFPGYGTHLVPPVFPTPLYESVTAFLFFALLWSVRKRIQTPLVLFGIYMMLNGFARFWVEKIRVNATYDLLGFSVTQAELISSALFVGGAVLLYVKLVKDKAVQDTSHSGAG